MRKKACIIYLLCLALCLYFPFKTSHAGVGGMDMEQDDTQVIDFQGFFSPDHNAVNLYRTLKFDAYKMSGTEEHRKKAEAKLSSGKPAAFFLEGTRKIDKRLTVLVVGMMYCPDCAAIYPYVQAMEAANPFIRVRYIVRDSAPEVMDFLSSRTERTNVPSIFIVRPGKKMGNRRGEILNGAYVETPSRVTALLDAAKSDEERKVIWDDFHSGVYDEDIQRDLLDLILNAWDQRNAE